MLIANSYVELFFWPLLAIAIGLGIWIGVRVAMFDQRAVLYWCRRAKSAEGELRKLRKATHD